MVIMRDFTYIDDAVKMLTSLINRPPKGIVPYDNFNLSNSKPVPLKTYLRALEKESGITAKLNKMPLQVGDVYKTHASNKKLEKKIGKTKPTNLDDGINKFVKWYKSYYN